MPARALGTDVTERGPAPPVARTAHLRPAGSPHPGPRLRRALVGALVALLVVPVVATADPLPTDPSVSGGSLAWTSAASVTLTASGSTWLGGPVDGYESRVSADGGATWSLPVPGATAGVSAEGESLVEFRSVAAGGLAVSAWAPDPATAASTVRIDRTAPAGLVVSGGSLSWQSVGGIAIGAGGAVVLALVLAARLPQLVAGAAVLLGGAYAASLSIGDDGVDLAAPLVAAGLLLACELAFWAYELRTTSPDEPGLLALRAAWLSLLGLGALAVGAVVVTLVGVARVEGLAVEAVGAAAALGIGLVLLASARRRA